MKKEIIGLTGQSGAGKTTVSFIFKQNDFFVINADKIARELQNEQHTLSLLSSAFGKEIITENNALDRRKLAKIVFSDKNQLTKLNNIMFPLVTDKINQIISKTEEDFILLDAPQLYESGADKLCNTIVAVIASKKKLIERVMERDEISYEDAEKRLNSQKSEDFFIQNATYIIKNDTDLENLIREADNIAKIIKYE